MGFGQAISVGFSKYLNFTDRACRSEYWYWTLFTVIVSILTALIDAQLDTGFINPIFQFVIFLPGIAIAVRRLHDIDHSGWWILIGLVPLVGAILLLVWYATKGTDGPNRFGPDPLAAEPSLPNQEFGAPA
jgi:uncharacterized membrane protein YhaH (DUF805 family)